MLSQFHPFNTATSHFLKIPFNIILPSMPGSPQWSLSLRFTHQNLLYGYLSPSQCVLHVSPISFFWNLSRERYWVSSTDHEATHYVVFSTHLLPRPSLTQILLSTPSVYVPPSVSATKFHTHTKQQEKVEFCVLLDGKTEADRHFF
jgi:hypothetical protein